MSSDRSDNQRNLSQRTAALVLPDEGWYNELNMRMRLVGLAALVLVLVSLTPAPAGADATLFLGTTTSPTHRIVRGFAAGVSLLVVGFEFEYANTTEDSLLLAPSLRTTSGNVFAQTFNLSGFQLYATTGAGIYRERLGSDQETNFVMNNGGGVKVNLAGPLRARVDYRLFNLKGNPQHAKVQRVYAGLNLAF